jgi:hypothetical protein
MAFTFLRWARAGMAAALEPVAQEPATSDRAQLTVGVLVSASAVGVPDQLGSVDLDLLGPRDVTGIDPRQVIETFPVPGKLDFEPAYFAHVELDRPDLPWLFTPHGPKADGALRPWIALVVVERGENAELEAAMPLPRLTVRGPEVAKLPAIADAHAWAHVQITGDASNGAQAITANEPERILSRLVCPRVLDPERAYIAAVVPTYKAGALAGLGQAVPATAPLDAWSSADPQVELPVYHHWEFATGAGGSFRELVLRLEAQDDLPGVGTRDLDVTEPGFGVDDRTQETIIDLGGALRVEQPAEPPVEAGLAADIEPVINTPEAVAPPIYGRWHAAVDSVSVPSGSSAGWPDALNLDQRHRVAAGIGTLIVQERQEDLMAAVWEQLGEILRANQLLRQAQLAVATSERVVARHLAPLSDAELLALAGPAVARIRLSPNTTLRGAVADSCLPLLALSGAFRRIVRAHGPLDRRLTRRAFASPPDLAPPQVDTTSAIESLASGALAAPPIRMPAGAVALPGGGRPELPELVSPSPPPFGRQPFREGREGLVRPPFGGGREPGSDLLAELSTTFATLAARAQSDGCSELELGPVGATVWARLEPDVAVAARARRRIKLPPSARVHLSGRLDPIMAAPEIPTPMIGPLLELGEEWLLPGIDEMPPNSVAIVEPNPEFIESYMVGLNHEMARELLWRGFPTDQRGTVFSVFWDRRGAVATRNVQVPDRDLPPIHEWDPKTALGGHLAQGSKDLVVLLIRGELLERYPHPTIYLQRGRWVRGARGDILYEDDLAIRSPVALPDDAAWDAHTRFPVFRAMAGADISFLGFPLAKDEVRGVDRGTARPDARDAEAGWYVVFEEQPTRPRFGDGPQPTPLLADTLARDLLRPAFRLFVHASDLVAA